MSAQGKVSGLILAGGRGRRMQTLSPDVVEKGLVLLHGRPLVAWAVSALPVGLANIYISANRYHDDYRSYGTVVSDNPMLGHDAGPLAGVASALAQSVTPWLYVAPVDVPCPPPHVFPALWRKVQHDGATLAYVQSARPQPLFMLVNKCHVETLEDSLRRGLRKVQTWQQAHGTPVSIADDGAGFFNVNSPDDLARAHELIAAPL